jgi:putative transposase
VPWRESSPMSERFEFIKACFDRKNKTIAEICFDFGISEKTGHKFIKRFMESGEKGLKDRSHAVLHHPFRITEEVQSRILELKKAHPDYGPQIIHDRLVQHEPDVHWPAASSIGEFLKRQGLVRRRPRRNRDHERVHLNSHLTEPTEPNLVWTADFKGQFRVYSRFGVYCYPLTVMDLNSRFVLGIRALETTSVDQTKCEFVRIFREYGLPRVIRTDNGVPFAQANALGRLGHLAFWWVRLGIKPEHIRPGKPQENGAHERFHKTLKAATAKPPSVSLRSQQKRFDEFITEYNSHRPHRSLARRRPPREFYSPSTRPYPNRLPELSYDEGTLVRLVGSNGCIKWQQRPIMISTNITNQYVGITEAEGDRFRVSYGDLQLGWIVAETGDFKPEVRWEEPN